MGKNKNRNNENMNVKLGGMGLYGTTSNREIGGYKTSGDIENAGQIDKGFKRPEDQDDAMPEASLEEDNREQDY
ncbi:hypothetical protein ACLIA0_07210 [Bacillaceae bacterium W0354]